MGTARAVQWELELVNKDLWSLRNDMEETKKALNQVDDFSGPLIGTYKPFEIIDNIYCRACYDWNGGIGEPNTGGCCQHSQPDKCKNPILQPPGGL